MDRQAKNSLADAIGYLVGSAVVLILMAAALGAAWRVFVWASGIEALR